MALFKDTTIRKGVMLIVEQRIELAQKTFDDTCVKLDDKYEEDVTKLGEKLENDKKKTADELIKVIVGKIL